MDQICLGELDGLPPIYLPCTKCDFVTTTKPQFTYPLLQTTTESQSAVFTYWFENDKQEMRNYCTSQQFLIILLSCFRARMSGDCSRGTNDDDRWFCPPPPPPFRLLFFLARGIFVLRNSFLRRWVYSRKSPLSEFLIPSIYQICELIKTDARWRIMTKI